LTIYDTHFSVIAFIYMQKPVGVSDQWL